MKCAYTRSDGFAQRHLLDDPQSPAVAYCGSAAPRHGWQNRNEQCIDATHGHRNYSHDFLQAADVPRRMH